MRRVAFVGFGSIAENGHLPAWLSLPGVHVVAVADVSPECRLRASSLLPDAAMYASSQELLKREQVDIIDVCSPPNTHVDVIVDACRHGIPTILCEKPFVLSPEEYARVAAARGHVRVVSVNNWLQSDLFRMVRAVIDSGEVGEVHEIFLKTERPRVALGNSSWNPGWRTDAHHSGGGIVLDHGWHQLYLLLGWLRMPVQSIHAVLDTRDPRNRPVEDAAAIQLNFGRSIGRIEMSWTADRRLNEGCVRASRAGIEILDDRIIITTARGSREQLFSGRLTESSYHPDWFAAMLRYSVLDVDRAESERNFAEAGFLVNLIHAIYCSAMDGGKPKHVEGEPKAELIDVRGGGSSS